MLRTPNEVCKDWIDTYNKAHEDHHGKIWIVDKVQDGIHTAAPIIDITDNLNLAFLAGSLVTQKNTIQLLKDYGLWVEPTNKNVFTDKMELFCSLLADHVKNLEKDAFEG